MVKQQLAEKIKHLPSKQQKKIINQAIDIAINMYRESKLQEDFDIIVELYQPLKFLNYWKNKYGHLCDNNIEDFTSEYMLCFIKACQSYNKDKCSNYFNKYFFSIISNHFKNKMSKLSCSKRNPSSKCPLCDKIVSPLNIHILREHDDLIKKLILEHNMGEKCPFCPEIYEGQILYKHVASKHSSIVYDYFQKFFPDYKTKIQDPAPPIGLIYIGDEAIGSLEDIDAKPLHYVNPDFENVVVLKDLTECQKTIKDIFSFYNISKLPSCKKLCSMCLEMRKCESCPRGEFEFDKLIYEGEIADLAEKMKEGGLI